MKYIVLAFDDGLKDFYDNAKPILRKYNFNSVINVITGSIDGTRNDDSEYDFMDVKDIKKCISEGDEIALHSDLHIHLETQEDFKNCYEKMRDWFSLDVFGVTMPYNQKPADDLINYFISINVPYVAIGGKVGSSLFERLLYKITKKKKHLLASLEQKSIVKKQFINGCRIINRVEILKRFSAEDYHYIIKEMKNNSCMVLMFHSILLNHDIKCPYPGGAWDVIEFDRLLEKISLNKNIKVLTLKEYLNKEPI